MLPERIELLISKLRKIKDQCLSLIDLQSEHEKISNAVNIITNDVDVLSRSLRTMINDEENESWRQDLNQIVS